MADKKRHSGFFYRKRKLQQTSEAQKQASALKRFVTVLPSEPHAPTFFLSEVS